MLKIDPKWFAARRIIQGPAAADTSKDGYKTISQAKIGSYLHCIHTLTVFSRKFLIKPYRLGSSAVCCQHESSVQQFRTNLEVIVWHSLYKKLSFSASWFLLPADKNKKNQSKHCSLRKICSKNKIQLGIKFKPTDAVEVEYSWTIQNKIPCRFYQKHAVNNQLNVFIRWRTRFLSIKKTNHPQIEKMKPNNHSKLKSRHRHDVSNRLFLLQWPFHLP